MSGPEAIEVERRPTPNFAQGRAGCTPRGIVVHTTAGSYESAVSWFASRESGVSSHYLVALDGRVAQFVEEEDTARHAGRVLNPTAGLISGSDDPNLYTVGIEFEDGGDPDGVERTDEQYAAGARLIAAIARRWRIPLNREHLIGHREVFSAKGCPGNLDLERLTREARKRSNRVVCLLPVRNAAADLPGYLDSVGRVADAVVALDDGSTDETAGLLEASPLVELVLSNPRREGYGGWDDAGNREHLLEAAARIEPSWVIFLDADERLDPEDASALRAFLDSDAIPGCAYGLELHRMWGDRLSVGAFNWVYRLFAFTPNLSLPERRLHFNPVPVQVSRRAWVRTTVRVRHLDSPERLAERRAKYEQADPDRAHERRPARLLKEPAERDLRPWTRRDPATPVLDPGAVARRLSAEPPPAPQRDRRLVCLLPVRNGEKDVPGYLDSVGRFADAVIALDDGSDDRTAELLEQSELVEVLLRNPLRADYRGWDDAANRSRLLAEAVRTGAAWALWLDADERIDPDDGTALRRFVEREADPEAAYGFRVFRMVGDRDHYDEAELWVYRLFAPSPGQRLPEKRLHLVPIPLSIPRSKWTRTTVRIQHLASLTGSRRLARYAKYEQADPEHRFQRDYSQLLKAERKVRPWKRRPEGLPVLADPLERGARAELDLERLDLDAPILSAIVISRNDEDRIERAVRAVVEQECPQPFEVIVVVSGGDRTAEIVSEKFPGVRLIELDGPALPGRARNAGVAVARGEYLSFPGSHVELPPGSLAARIEAHELGYSMVTGSIVNGTPTLSGWASYFLDHAGSLPGRPSAELEAPPAHCSYGREFVLEVGGFPEHLRAGEDTVVNRTLFSRGHRAYRAQDVRLVHRSRCSRPWRLLRHHFGRGRSWGRIVLEDHRGGRRLLRWPMISYLFFRYVPSRLARTSRQVRRWGGRDLRRHYRRSMFLVALATLAAWIGIWVEIVRPLRGKLGVLFADQRRPLPASAMLSEDENVLTVDHPGDSVVSEGGHEEGGVHAAELLQRRP